MKASLRRQEWYFFKDEKDDQYKLFKFVPSPESKKTRPQKINKDKKDYKREDWAAYAYFFSKIEKPNKIPHSCSAPSFENL